MPSTTPTDAPKPIIILKKSLPTKGNTFLKLSLLVSVAIANSLPVKSPTKTQVVHIGMLFSSLKNQSTKK